ncbi:glycosyltransferase [Collinsella sp. LCP19S3_H3]|uniref:glycosyltransferase n=1 Tax=Collinsella sp. LCP19S3_H3 TaxID=3438768 RepID=UPI003F91E08B
MSASYCPLLSIVVPVYNVGGYLLDTLDSIAAQSYSNIEIICVDDGSTDGSGELLDLYAARDSRFAVYHEVNRGVSAARNFGIDKAHGEIVLFVDADDLLKSNACDVIRQAFDNDDQVDILKFSADPFPIELSNPWLTSTLSLDDEEYSGYSDKLVFYAKTRPFPWNGAYRLSFLRDHELYFPVGLTLGEDQVFSFATLGRSSRTKLLSDSLYDYRLSRKDSAMCLMAQDEKLRLQKHLQVVDCIMADWGKQGRFEGESGRSMLLFVADFLVFDLLEIRNQAVREELLRELQRILSKYLTIDEIEQLLSGDRILKFYQQLLAQDGPASFGASSIYSFVAELKGYKAAVFMLIDRAKTSLLTACGVLSAKDIQDDLFEDAPSISEAIEAFKSRS